MIHIYYPKHCKFCKRKLKILNLFNIFWSFKSLIYSIAPKITEYFDWFNVRYMYNVIIYWFITSYIKKWICTENVWIWLKFKKLRKTNKFVHNNLANKTAYRTNEWQVQKCNVRLTINLRKVPEIKQLYKNLITPPPPKTKSDKQTNNKIKLCFLLLFSADLD